MTVVAWADVLAKLGAFLFASCLPLKCQPEKQRNNTNSLVMP